MSACAMNSQSFGDQFSTPKMREIFFGLHGCVEMVRLETAFAHAVAEAAAVMAMPLGTICKSAHESMSLKRVKSRQCKDLCLRARLVLRSYRTSVI